MGMSYESLNPLVCDVAIVGAGVTGTALAYVLSKYSDAKDVVLVEKEDAPGTVNSSATNNSQTLHTGDIETNYTLAQALAVQRKAGLLSAYALLKNDPTLACVCHKMVLGVGSDEVHELMKRFEEFAPHYLDLELIDGEEITRREPSVMKGRDPRVPVCALASRNGVMVNYQELSKAFLRDAQTCNPNLKVMFGTNVFEVVDDIFGVIIKTNNGIIFAKTAMFASGAYSLRFAHMSGLAKNYALLPVAGSYYVAKSALLGKVYRVQTKGIPFAAVHGDPEITDMSMTRLGPTTKPLPLMERHRYTTMGPFLKLYQGNVIKGISSLIRIVLARHLTWYVIKNMLYDIPLLGKFLFLKEARSIIPDLKYSDLILRKGAGGIRPQLVDLNTSDLVMGDATIHGKRTTFNTTPSPGASVSLANGVEYAAKIVSALGPRYSLDKEALARDLGLKK